MTNMKLLVTGGAASGKSDYAIEVADSLTGGEHYFIATAQPLDDEMKARIERHKKSRGSRWQTVEEPVDLAGALTGIDTDDSVVVVDCLNLWTSNLLEKNDSEFHEALSRLASVVALFNGSLIIVTNEVGMGIVPANPTTRLFRDRLGAVNREIAKVCKSVVLMVSGIPIQIKGEN